MLCICSQVAAQSTQRVDENDSLIFLQKPSFVVWYNYTRLVPALVCWNLCTVDLGHNLRPSSQSFLTDSDLPRPRAKSKDYTRSGFQRGHLCPSADRSASAQLMRATFVMSNVAPMLPTLNMRGWALAEEHARIIARSGYRCHVVAGSIFSKDSIIYLGESAIMVPDSFFRAVIVPECPDLSVFWLFPNSDEATVESRFRVSSRRFRRSLRHKVRNILDELKLL